MNLTCTFWVVSGARRYCGDLGFQCRGAERTDAILNRVPTSNNECGSIDVEIRSYYLGYGYCEDIHTEKWAPLAYRRWFIRQILSGDACNSKIMSSCADYLKMVPCCNIYLASDWIAGEYGAWNSNH